MFYIYWNKGTTVMYWTGCDWTLNRDEAREYTQRVIARKIARLLMERAMFMHQFKVGGE